MRKYFKDMLNTFCIINTGITIGASVFIYIFQNGVSLDVNILWQILIVSLLTSSINIVFYSKVELSKKEILVRGGIQYLLINIITLTCAYFFRWIDFKSFNIIVGLTLTILFVFIFTWLICYINDAKVAEQLNAKIDEYNKKNEE